MDENTRLLIEQLAAKLGTTADHVWGILIQQAMVSAITNSIFAAAALITSIIIINRLNKLDYDKYDVLPDVGKVLTYALSAVAIPILVYSAITGFANPEYWALSQILGLIR